MTDNPRLQFELFLGDLVLREGMSSGHVWLGRLDENGHEGEGGDFPIVEVSAALLAYFTSRF